MNTKTNVGKLSKKVNKFRKQDSDKITFLIKQKFCEIL